LSSVPPPPTNEAKAGPQPQGAIQPVASPHHISQSHVPSSVHKVAAVDDEISEYSSDEDQDRSRKVVHVDCNGNRRKSSIESLNEATPRRPGRKRARHPAGARSVQGNSTRLQCPPSASRSATKPPEGGPAQVHSNVTAAARGSVAVDHIKVPQRETQKLVHEASAAASMTSKHRRSIHDVLGKGSSSAPLAPMTANADILAADTGVPPATTPGCNLVPKGQQFMTRFLVTKVNGEGLHSEKSSVNEYIRTKGPTTTTERKRAVGTGAWAWWHYRGEARLGV